MRLRLQMQMCLWQRKATSKFLRLQTTRWLPTPNRRCHKRRKAVSRVLPAWKLTLRPLLSLPLSHQLCQLCQPHPLTVSISTPLSTYKRRGRGKNVVAADLLSPVSSGHLIGSDGNRSDSADTALERTFKVKEVNIWGRTVPVILQDTNGPCPLLSIGAPPQLSPVCIL